MLIKFNRFNHRLKILEIKMQQCQKQLSSEQIILRLQKSLNSDVKNSKNSISTTIRINPTVLEAFRFLCVKEGLSLKEGYNLALLQFIKSLESP